jgi:hypothetical protein
MSKASINEVLTFSTCLSNNNSSSNPAFYFPSLFNVSGYMVSSFTSVNTFYNIDSRNNNFSFTETGKSAVVITLPSGNYTITTIQTELVSLMNSATLSSGTYTTSVNSLTNILSITGSVAFHITNTINNCYYELGLIPSTTFALTVVGNKSFDLSGVSLIHLVSSSFGDASKLVNNNYNIMASIPVEGSYLAPIQFTGIPVFINCSLVQLSQCSFQLLDQRSRILNTVSDFSLSVILETE